MMTAIPRISGPTSSRTPPSTTLQLKISVPMSGPGTLAADVGFLSPGTKVYVPALARYYVMEDTCRECSEDWLQSKPHIDLYVSGTGPELAACQERLTMESAMIYIDPPPGLPVRPWSACRS